MGLRCRPQSARANDNNPDNTCARFRAGRTNSWVEVDTDCKSFRKKGANAGMQTAPLGVDRSEPAEHEHTEHEH